MPRILRAAMVVAATGSALLFGACGSDPAPAASAGDTVVAETGVGSAATGGSAPGACGLVSTDELAAILQKAEPAEKAITVTTTERAVGTGSSICSVTWGGDLSTGREFQIDVFSADTLPFVVETPQRSAIAGIGDEAYLGQEGNFYAQVGDWAVHVVNVQITDEVSTQILAAAAKGLGSS